MSHGTGKSYLVVNIGSPEAGNSAFIRVRREDGGSGRPSLVDVLNDDEGLAYGLLIVDENWDFLVNWVGLEEELTLGSQFLLMELVVYGLDVKGDPSSHHKWAWPCTQKLDFTLSHDYNLKQSNRVLQYRNVKRKSQAIKSMVALYMNNEYK